MLVGDKIKYHLVSILDTHQPGKSSHWQEQLQRFSYSEDTGISGLIGLGSTSSGGVVRRALHWLMQIPLRVSAGNYRRQHQLMRSARHIARSQGRLLDQDILRQVLTYAFCERRLPWLRENGVSVVIGDGFGVLASLLYLHTKNKIVSINLSEILLTDYVSTRGIVPSGATALVESTSELNDALAEQDIRLVYLQAKDHELLRMLDISMAFSVCSMHEMDPSIAQQYFADLRGCKGREAFFYCCSRVKKVMPDGTVTRFEQYPWFAEDDILVVGLCPWNQYFYSGGLPYYRKFAGPVQHRLARLASTVEP